MTFQTFQNPKPIVKRVTLTIPAVDLLDAELTRLARSGRTSSTRATAKKALDARSRTRSRTVSAARTNGISGFDSLDNPDKKKKGKSSKASARKAKVKKYAKKHGLTIKQAVAEIKAKMKAKKVSGARTTPEETELLEGAQEIVETGDFADEAVEEATPEEEEEGGMNYLVLVGVGAALAAGAFFWVRRRQAA
jgi:cobalamin biosynthesis Mg chelatase CobN